MTTHNPPPGPVDVFAFSRDLAALRAELDWLHGHEDHDQTPYGPAVHALEAILDALEAGHDRVESTSHAITVWRAAHKTRADQQKHDQEQRAADYARRMAEEETTRKVECPYCGAHPGASCRTTGALQTVRTDSHRDRYRHARNLHDTSRADPNQP